AGESSGIHLGEAALPRVVPTVPHVVDAAAVPHYAILANIFERVGDRFVCTETFAKGKVGVCVEHGAAGPGQLRGVSGSIELVKVSRPRCIDAAGESDAIDVVGLEIAGAIVFADDVAHTAWIDEILGPHAVMSACDPVAEGIVFV